MDERGKSIDELQTKLERKMRHDLVLQRELGKLASDVEIARKTLQIYGPALQASLESARRVIEMLPDSAYVRTIQLASEAVAFTQSLAETRKLEAELLPQLAAHGWLISPLADADTPRELHQAFVASGIISAEAELMAMMCAEACRAVVDDLATKPSYAQWSPTFAKALGAQERGEHELAIPIWLAALDGVCNQELGVQAYSIQNSRRKRLAIKKQILPRLAPVYEPIADAWLDVLTGFSKATNPSTPVVLNRNAVLHGEIPHIGTAKDSVQCLLALQVLKWLLTMRDEAEAEVRQWRFGASPSRTTEPSGLEPQGYSGLPADRQGE